MKRKNCENSFDYYSFFTHQQGYIWGRSNQASIPSSIFKSIANNLTVLITLCCTSNVALTEKTNTVLIPFTMICCIINSKIQIIDANYLIYYRKHSKTKLIYPISYSIFWISHLAFYYSFRSETASFLTFLTTSLSTIPWVYSLIKMILIRRKTAQDFYTEDNYHCSFLSTISSIARFFIIGRMANLHYIRNWSNIVVNLAISGPVFAGVIGINFFAFYVRYHINTHGIRDPLEGLLVVFYLAILIISWVAAVIALRVLRKDEFWDFREDWAFERMAKKIGVCTVTLIFGVYSWNIFLRRVRKYWAVRNRNDRN